MAEIHPYYADWETRQFRCGSCGWSGDAAQMPSELHTELVDYSCPRCDRMILIVPLPTLGDIRAAAAAGSPEAVAQLARIEGRED
jgi:DNA-directed RNA polymerase subunit RPC12/RpoP